MSLACLDTLIGLSRTEYECFADDAPEGFGSSDSGYFMTDPDYGLTILENCNLEAGWAMLNAAKNQAISEVQKDLLAAIRAKFDGSLSPFSGHIGKKKSTGASAGSGDYIGVRIRAKRQKGTKLIIKKIMLGINQSGALDIAITSNDPTFAPQAVVPITTVANSFAASGDVDIELPFWSDYAEEKYFEYYISVPRGTAQPLNNKIRCCNDNPGWAKHAEVSGFRANTDTPENTGSFSSAGMGFVLDAYLACDELDWICELEELNGMYFQDVLARALQFRAVSIAISSLTDTLQINPCSYDTEQLNARRNWMMEQYSINIDWISNSIPIGATSCFTCKPGNKFHKSKIIV